MRSEEAFQILSAPNQCNLKFLSIVVKSNAIVASVVLEMCVQKTRERRIMSYEELEITFLQVKSVKDSHVWVCDQRM